MDTAVVADLPHPAAALERRYREILRTQMRDVPLVHPALGVHAVGFRPHGEDWLGVLVTPWFMNLLLLPRKASAWRPLAPRETRALVFPAGVFEFIGANDAELGNTLACSLYSPMFAFADDATARATAAAALEALFDARQAMADETLPAPARTADGGSAPVVDAPAPPAAGGRRAFLFGPRAAPGGSDGA